MTRRSRKTLAWRLATLALSGLLWTLPLLATGCSDGGNRGRNPVEAGHGSVAGPIGEVPPASGVLGPPRDPGDREPVTTGTTGPGPTSGTTGGTAR